MSICQGHSSEIDGAHQLVSVPRTASRWNRRGAGCEGKSEQPFKKSKIEEVFCFSVCYNGHVTINQLERKVKNNMGKVLYD